MSIMKKQKSQTINRWILLCLSGLILNAGTTVMAETMPNNSRETLERVQVMMSQRHWDQAVSLMEANLERAPLDFATRVRLADLHLRMDNPAAAYRLLNEADLLYPESVEPVLLNGYIVLGPLVAQGDVAEEESLVNQMNALAHQAKYLDDSHPGVHYLQGMAARLRADNEAAEAFLLRALYADPDYLRALQALIELYAEQHQVKLAVPLVGQALDLEPENVDTLYLVGRVFVEKGDPGRGLKYLEASQQKDPLDRPKRLLVMAEAQRQLGQLHEAARNYQKVLTYWPERADIWQKYGQVATTLHLDEDALMAFRRAYALQPAMLDPLIAQADQVFWTKPLREALPHYRRIVQIAPEREEYLVLLVQMHYRLWQEGLRPLQSTLDELEQWLRERERKHLVPPLQLADIQTQVMRGEGWSDGLKTVAEEVVERTESPFLKALGYLWAQQPERAVIDETVFKEASNPGYEVQRMMLSGAWPWVVKMLDADVGLDRMANGINTWANKDEAMYQSLMADVKVFNDTRQFNSALSTLNKAQVYHPLSPDIQIQRIKAYLALQQLPEANQAFERALAMGVNSAGNSFLSELEKALRIANAQAARQSLQKPEEPELPPQP